MVQRLGNDGSVYQNGKDGWDVRLKQDWENIFHLGLVLRALCGSWVSQCGVILRGLTWRFHFRLVYKMLFKTMTIKVTEGFAG